MERVFLTAFNESSEEEPNAYLEPPRESDVTIDMPSRDKTVEIIKYLKNNKAAGSKSIAAELLKGGGPSLVNALNEMIQQVWIGKTQTES
jgi:hypothetical protein